MSAAGRGDGDAGGGVRVTVAAGDEGRIDKALARQFPSAGRRELAALFSDGAVRLRGRRANKGDRVVAGDVIELARAPVGGPRIADAGAPGGTRANPALFPRPDPSLALDVLLERAELIALAKPAGVPSQPLRAGELGTAANAIAARWPECAAIGDDPRDGGLVHRLDVGTSGVLLAARTQAAYRALRDAFGTGRVAKEYLALTDARPVARECDAPLAQRGDHVRVDHTDGLSAHTEIEVERAAARHALVRCRARTGRMHQVRAHLAHVGAPIAGDVMYGGAPVPGADGFFLHAARVRVALDGEEIVIEAPLPERFRAALVATGLG